MPSANSRSSSNSLPRACSMPSPSMLSRPHAADRVAPPGHRARLQLPQVLNRCRQRAMTLLPPRPRLPVVRPRLRLVPTLEHHRRMLPAMLPPTLQQVANCSSAIDATVGSMDGGDAAGGAASVSCRRKALKLPIATVTAMTMMENSSWAVAGERTTCGDAGSSAATAMALPTVGAVGEQRRTSFSMRGRGRYQRSPQRRADTNDQNLCRQSWQRGSSTNGDANERRA